MYSPGDLDASQIELMGFFFSKLYKPYLNILGGKKKKTHYHSWEMKLRQITYLEDFTLSPVLSDV